MYIDNFSSYVQTAIEPFNKVIKDTVVFVVSNVKNVTKTDDYAAHSVLTDFFSEEEFEEIITGFRKKGLYVESFTNELDFINYVQKGKIDELPFKNKIVYNTSQKGTGPGRHSLIPAFCKASNIPLIGSNAYVAALSRHKYHCNKLVGEHIRSVPDAWLYKTSGWLLDISPPQFSELIIKPIHEAASIGVKPIVFDNSTMNLIHKASLEYLQPIIAEQFIEGYEVEVPVIIDKNGYHALGPIGIEMNGKRNLGKNILSYDNVYDNKYSFYDFRKENCEVGNLILSAAEKAAEIIGFEDYARLDFRVDKKNNYYLTDTTNNPHIVSHSSFYYYFKNAGLTHSDLVVLLLSLATKRYGLL